MFRLNSGAARRSPAKLAALTVSALALMASAAAARTADPNYLAYDGGLTRLAPDDSIVPTSPTHFQPNGPSSSVSLSFEGISQLDVRALHGNFSEIPPDTNGAVGATQFFEVSNGAYAVYDKATGARTALWGDGAFWAAAGQPASNGFAGFSNGDSRVLYDTRSSRWIVESFGASLDSIQIAVSTTSDALGPWRSTTFAGHTGAPSFTAGISDYPTLAIDNKAVYIGTNDFTSGGAFSGETLNVIARSDLFGPGAPVATSLKQFFTPLSAIIGGADPGFAIQGVNQLGNTDSGKILAVSIQTSDLIRYNVTNPGTAGATTTPTVYLGTTPYVANNPGRQPDGSRVIDTLDDRVSSAVWEQGGKIYAVHTVTATGTDHTEVVWTVSNATTNALIQQGTISSPNYDYYQGSITVNSLGQAVIGYNRSGSTKGLGNVRIYAETFNSLANGRLTETGNFLLHASPIDDYHNGSVDGAAPVGRQRWGDYAQVTVDPNNPESFWVIGEFAKGYLPNPDLSFSRWGTWISDVVLTAPGGSRDLTASQGGPDLSGPTGVPEPATWAMMLTGFGLLGAAIRRKAKQTVPSAA